MSTISTDVKTKPNAKIISKHNVLQNEHDIQDDSKILLNESEFETFMIDNTDIDCQKLFSEMKLTDVYDYNTNFDSKKIQINEITEINNKENNISNNTKQINDDTLVIDNIDNNENNNTNIGKKYNICPECQIPCKINDIFLICEQCGWQREYDCHTHDNYSLSIESNYNTTNNSFMTFNIIGTNSYYYNRSLLKTCADYTSYRANSNKKDIINKIYQYEGNKPPLNVINETADLFDKIKQAGYVYRGDGKLGVIGACLYYISIKNNLTRSPKEVAKIMGIEERFLSQGDRILQELAELNVIEIPTNYKPLNDYLNTFLPCLYIPEKYKYFIIDIIERAERKHLHIGHECRLTTKIVGVIYILTLRVPELKHIKKDTISAECNNISKSTFIKYATLIFDNYKLMKKPFRKWKIPMPVEWRD